ncbi:unnamed protein product [Meloidogyne enterolobii]|uniref:Uncharacterized protein n=1 Tax=Meloidogyne enterolobii TaxID=390850 RepID=A0ACB0Y9N7_MELEN
MPNYPSNIEQMLFIQNCLEHLFNCTYEIIYFSELINPELIKLLFEDSKIPPQFNILYNCQFSFKNYCSCPNILNFVLNYLKVGNWLIIDFLKIWNLEDNLNMLLNLLTKEGQRFKKVYCQSIGEPTIFKMIIKVRKLS